MRAGIDDFHPPGHGPRSAAGGYTAESYYAEGYDYLAFRNLLLAPLDNENAVAPRFISMNDQIKRRKEDRHQSPQ